MGNKQNKEQNYTNSVEDSSFFFKKMVVRRKIDKINDYYMLTSEIGKGTYAQVFKAQDVKSKK